MALVHDYLTQYGGAEKVLEALHRLWPEAPIFTTFFDAATMRRSGFSIPARNIRTLLPPQLNRTRSAVKLWAPFYPGIFSQLDLSAYDLVISSSSYAAHHVRCRPGATHIAYLHSPPRFLYGLTTELNHGRMVRRFPPLEIVYSRMRATDQRAAARIDVIVANSQEVQHRIARFYHRQAQVIYPPVATEVFAATESRSSEEYFFTWSRLVASKRIDVLVAAATSTQLPLIVAGEGPELQFLRSIAGPSVQFVGRVSRERLLDLLAHCTAVLFAAEEDFGIVPVEAMAAGKPVIALARGGVLETVLPGVTGELFASPVAATLAPVLRAFNPSLYNSTACRRQAARFDEQVFSNAMLELVHEQYASRVANAKRFQ